MKALVIGCGRVGSNVALELSRAGWEVVAVDESEDAILRLGDRWGGRFVVGHGMDVEILHQAGIDDADAVVVSTNGDNTNLVIAQVAQKRYGVERVVVRVLDPARARWYEERGLQIVSPTSTAIQTLVAGVQAGDGEAAGSAA